MDIADAVRVMAANRTASLRHTLDWNPASAVIREPGAAREVFAVLAAEPTPSEAMVQVLTTLLDTARAAAENRQAGGSAFLADCSAVLAELDAASALSGTRMLAWAGAYVRAGLEPPLALQISTQGQLPPPRIALLPGLGGDPVVMHPTLDDPGQRMVEAFLADLPLNQADAYTAFRELLGVAAVPSRVILVHLLIQKLPASHERIALYWLFDPVASIRSGAAHAIATRIRTQGAGPGLRRDLERARNWLPAEPGLDALGDLLEKAQPTSDATPHEDIEPANGAKARRGRARGKAAGAPAANTIRAFLSLPDGAGCISIVIPIRNHEGYSTTLGLFKRGHGLREIFSHPFKSALEQRQMLESLSREVGLIEVSTRFVASFMGRAIDDGVHSHSPPSPLLLDAADLLEAHTGAPLMRLPFTLEALLADLPGDVQTQLADKDLCSQLCGEGGEHIWGSRLLDSWFEQTEDLDAALAAAPTRRVAQTLIWKVLQERRGWWAVQFALAAQILAAADAQKAQEPCVALAATARALAGKGSLRKLAALHWIMSGTLEAWRARNMAAEGLELDPEAALDEAIARATSPSGMRELSRLLKDFGLELQWLDGFGAAAAVSGLPPVTIGNELLKYFVGVHVSDVGLVIDLCLARLAFATECARDPDRILKMFLESQATTAAWATGFMAFAEAAPRAFSKRYIGGEAGVRILRLVSEAKTRALDAPEQKIIAAWVSQHSQ